jgi:protein ImuB
MVRLACVNLDRFPLQLLLKKHWEWRTLPLAVVTKESPQGTITYVNRTAESCGVLPGMRFATGLAMTSELRAGAVSRWEIDAAVDSLTRCLQLFSPEVEISRDEPGVFWLNAQGLSHLYTTVKRWIDRIRAALKKECFHATVAVGFTRFGSYAAAKSAKGNRIFSSPEAERNEAFLAALSILPFKPACYERFEKLGLKNIGSFLRLSPEAIRKRFGADVERLYHFAAGDLALPLQPLELSEDRAVAKRLLIPETDSSRLLFHIEQCLTSILSDADRRQELVAQLRLSFKLENGERLTEIIHPAAPTRDRAALLELFQIRLEALQLNAGIISLNLSASCVKATNIQLELFKKKPRRDLAKGARAFARIRAVLGNDSVQRAKLENDYLPEKRYSWETIEKPAAKPPLGTTQPICMVRRALRQPIPIDHERRDLSKLSGPYVISGRWWEKNLHRDYYFAETNRGELLWLYYNRSENCWMISGMVE